MSDAFWYHQLIIWKISRGFRFIMIQIIVRGWAKKINYKTIIIIW